MRRARKEYVWSVLVALGAPGVVHAVILRDSPLRNTSEPPAGNVAQAGWNLIGEWDTPVGALGKYTGVPIAEQYFLTAGHLKGSAVDTFKFRGTTYMIDPGYGTGGFVDIAGSDLRIWKVNQVFPDYAVLYHKKDEAGKHVGVIGRGTPRGAEIRDSSNVLKGWHWEPEDGVISWGENDVTSISAFSDVGEMLKFEFNAGATGQNESHLSFGDSGGGVFIQDGVSKLAGINFSTDGPYNTSATAVNSFFAALLDRGGFYEDRGSGWQLTQDTGTDKPGASYASLISPRLNDISNVVPGLPIHRSSYNIGSSINVGKIDVAGTVNIAAPGVPFIANAYYLRAGTVQFGANAELHLRPDGSHAATSNVQYLGTGHGRFDLADNDLVIRESELSTLRTQLLSGRGVAPGGAANARWNGETGLTSASATEAFNRDGLESHSLGYALNGDLVVPFTTFSGQPVDGNDLLVKYTRHGDANLDGVVNDNDVSILSGFYNPFHDPIADGPRHWYQGDFNYNGIVDDNDTTVLGGFYNPAAVEPADSRVTSSSSPFLVSTSASPHAAVVPEPTLALTVAAAGLLMILRRSR